jgi:hypothetical protein
MFCNPLYLIEPRHELTAWLHDRVDSELADLLRQPAVLSNKEADRSDWTDQAHVEAVKLVYVASLRQYSGLETDAEFEAALGSPRISVSLFDQWRTIKRLEFDGSIDELLPFLAQHIGSTDRTGISVVDDWLDWVQRRP